MPIPFSYHFVSKWWKVNNNTLADSDCAVWFLRVCPARYPPLCNWGNEMPGYFRQRLQAVICLTQNNFNIVIVKIIETCKVLQICFKQKILILTLVLICFFFNFWRVSFSDLVLIIIFFPTFYNWILVFFLKLCAPYLMNIFEAYNEYFLRRKNKYNIISMVYTKPKVCQYDELYKRKHCRKYTLVINKT